MWVSSPYSVPDNWNQMWQEEEEEEVTDYGCATGTSPVSKKLRHILFVLPCAIWLMDVIGTQFHHYYLSPPLSPKPFFYAGFFYSSSWAGSTLCCGRTIAFSRPTKKMRMIHKKWSWLHIIIPGYRSDLFFHNFRASIEAIDRRLHWVRWSTGLEALKLREVRTFS